MGSLGKGRLRGRERTHASRRDAMAESSLPADSSSPQLSVVVLSWNTRELTLACLAALGRDGFQGTREVIVVDNASADGSVAAVRERFPEVRLLVNSENLLFAAACNQGARAARGAWLCLLNSDTEVAPGALQQLVAFLADHPAYAMAGPQLRSPDGSIQRFCRRLPTRAEALFGAGILSRCWPGTRICARQAMQDFDHDHDADVEQPMGACMVLRRDEFLALGGFDELLALYYNDVDLCHDLRSRVRRIRFVSTARVMHHLGGSSGRNEMRLSLWWQNRTAWFAKRLGTIGSLLAHACLAVELASIILRTVLNPGRSLASKREGLARARALWTAVRAAARAARAKSIVAGSPAIPA